ncbi:unnamed protein product, partial [Mesorhabditis spiculigera]
MVYDFRQNLHSISTILMNWDWIVKDMILAIATIPTLAILIVIFVQFHRESLALRTAFEKLCLCLVVSDMINILTETIAWDIAFWGLVSFYSHIQFWGDNTHRLLSAAFSFSTGAALCMAFPETYYQQLGPSMWALYAGETYFLGLKLAVWNLLILLTWTVMSSVFNLLVVIKVFALRQGQLLTTGRLLSTAERKLCFVSLYACTFTLLYISAAVCHPPKVMLTF